jgi:hypothetical protein
MYAQVKILISRSCQIILACLCMWIGSKWSIDDSGPCVASQAINAVMLFTATQCYINLIYSNICIMHAYLYICHTSLISINFWLCVLIRYWQQELERRYQGSRPRLWIPVLKMVSLKIAIFTLLSFVENILVVTRAILVGLLAEYFVGDLTPENTRNALLYATGIACLLLYCYSAYACSHL